MTNDETSSRFIIASVIKGEAAAYHQKLVDAVAAKFGLRKINSPSHITLKDSFYLQETAAIEQVIAESVLALKQVGEIAIDGIGNFRSEIFYMHAELDHHAKAIFRNLLTNLHTITGLQWDQFDVMDRQFHLTITNKATASNSQQIAEFLQNFKPKFKLQFDNISILKKLDDQRKWIVHREFGL
jgi:2'-5' RNA ligase